MRNWKCPKIYSWHLKPALTDLCSQPAAENLHCKPSSGESGLMDLSFPSPTLEHPRCIVNPGLQLLDLSLPAVPTCPYSTMQAFWLGSAALAVSYCKITGLGPKSQWDSGSDPPPQQGPRYWMLANLNNTDLCVDGWGSWAQTQVWARVYSAPQTYPVRSDPASIESVENFHWLPL